MSRSYRKPWVKVGVPGAKNMANRAARRDGDLPDGCAYKRCYPQWDVCDWKWYAPGRKSWSSPPEDWKKYARK